MEYDSTLWSDGDVISSEKMNKLENGVKKAHEKIATSSNQVRTNQYDISTLKEELKKQHELFQNTVGLNNCDATKLEWSKNLSTSDGSETTAAESYGVTPFINLENVKKVNFYTCDVSGVPVGGCFRTFFYTIDKVLISYENNGDIALQQSISVPSNARYARFVIVKYGSRPNYMLVFDRDDTPNYEAYKEVEPPNVVEKLKTIDAIKDGSNAKAGYALKIKTLDESGKPNRFEYGEASGSVNNILVTSTNKLDNSNHRRLLWKRRSV